MLAHIDRRWLTPKHALIAALLLALIVPFYFVLWIDHEAMTCPIFTTAPATITPARKP